MGEIVQQGRTIRQAVSLSLSLLSIHFAQAPILPIFPITIHSFLDPEIAFILPFKEVLSFLLFSSHTHLALETLNFLLSFKFPGVKHVTMIMVTCEKRHFFITFCSH